MPFTPTKDLPKNPAVRIFFSGLMIIQPDENGEMCEVFVPRADNHDFSVQIRERRANKPDVVLMRHCGPLAFVSPPQDQPVFGLHLIASAPRGLQKYQGGPLPGGEDSLDLAIDLKSETFHHSMPIEVDVNEGRPSIFLNDGIFYTADIADADLGIKLLKDGHELGPMGSFATLIGSNIYLMDDDVLSVRWSRKDHAETFALKKPAEASSYEIYIHNDPLFVDPEFPEAHDELKQYYEMLSSIPTADQFSLKIPPAALKTPRGTPRTLCMSVMLGA